MAAPSEIVRCVKSDIGGSILSQVEYCENIARYARFNAFADPADADNYAEAARRLREELPVNPQPSQP